MAYLPWDWQEGQDPYSPYGLQTPKNLGDPAIMQRIQVPNVPQLSTDEGNFTDFMNRVGGQIQQQWQYNTPLAEAAQFDINGVPRPDAQQFGTSAELGRMLKGEGYSPDILAQMHAGAMENPSNAGIQELAAAKRALSMSGLGDSPAGAAVQADVARRTGQAQVAANRDVDVQNAEAGLQNFRTGMGMQTQIGLSNMEQANQMALANANRLFQAMSQNVSNRQAVNLSNAGAQQQKMTNQANQVGSFLGNQGNMWQTQRNDREQQNVQNQVNQQRDQTSYDAAQQQNQWGELNNRYRQAQAALTGFNPMAG